MALMTCRECENKYSDQAVACPKCGCPNPFYVSNTNVKGNKKFIVSIVVILIILIIAVVGIFAFVLSERNNTISNAGATSGEMEVKKETELVVYSRVYYKAIEDCVFALERELKSPQSLQINGIIINTKELYKTETDVVNGMNNTYGSVPNPKVLVSISYTAKNDFGNDIADTCTITNRGENGSELGFYMYDLYNSMYEIVRGRNENFSCGSIDGIWNNQSESDYYFEIDMDDYEAQGYFLK